MASKGEPGAGYDFESASPGERKVAPYGNVTWDEVILLSPWYEIVTLLRETHSPEPTAWGSAG
jgi:hypothetical protein